MTQLTTIAQFIKDHGIKHRTTVTRKVKNLGINYKTQGGLTPENVRVLKEALGIVEPETVEAELVETEIPTIEVGSSIEVFNQESQIQTPKVNAGFTVIIVQNQDTQAQNAIQTTDKQTSEMGDLLKQVLVAGVCNEALYAVTEAKGMIRSGVNEAMSEAAKLAAKKMGFQVTENG